MRGNTTSSLQVQDMMWNLASHRHPKGVLHVTRKFVGPAQPIRTRRVRVPLETDAGRAFENAGILASATHTRSFEMWWDSSASSLDVVLATGSGDMHEYEQDVRVMYPNAAFEDVPRAIPSWYNPEEEQYHVFDVGYRHGHFASVFDTACTRDVMTQMAAVSQLADRAWVQVAFRKHGFVRDMQRLKSIVRAKAKNISEALHYPAADLLLSDSAKPRPHSEKGGDLDTHSGILRRHMDQKAQGEQVMVSVRGLLSKKVAFDLSGVRSAPAGGGVGGYDHLVTNWYDWKKFVDYGKGGKKYHLSIDGSRVQCRRTAVFDGRLMPHPDEIRKPIGRYASKKLLGGYHTPRESPPFVLMNLAELGLLVNLPNPAVVPYAPATTRGVAKPQQTLAKVGFCLGFADVQTSLRVAETLARRDLVAAGVKRDGVKNRKEHGMENIMGTMTDAARTKCVVLSPSDIKTHMYLAGGTNSGKTTLIRCVAKHLEMANLRGTFANAFILVDPKGSDSYDFLRQCEPETYRMGRITFLDPIETKFSINVLELPPYRTAEDRQVVVSQYVGYIMQMIEYWYQGSDAFVRLRRILDTLLQYVYLKNDKPTFLDLYEIVVSMQKDGKSMLVKMYRALGRPESVLQQALEAVAGMQKEAYEPVLNRLEKFATDPILRHMFCVRESTMRFEDMIAPGSYTVIRLSPLNIPQHIITLTKQTLVVKLWFAIQERAERVKTESDRTQVLLALDEFQDLAGLPVIEAMLTQARSYGLGLLLAHQTTTQLDGRLFEIITGNAGTQLVGKVSGRDAERFGNVWDPAYAKQYKEQLATQEYHHWTARLVAGWGQAQPLPVQFWPLLIHKERQPASVIRGFIAEQRQRFGLGVPGVPALAESAAKDTEWLANVPYEPPEQGQWYVMCILGEAGAGMLLKEITQKYRDGTTASDDVSAILHTMLSQKMVAMRGGRYVLPYDVRRKYLEFDPARIGKATDIPQSTAAAVSHYLERRNFVCVAPQKVRKGRLRTDLAAYDYDASESISVEIESHVEVARHPEHVKLNMTKWRGMGFDRCDVWSTHPGIISVYDELRSDERRGVRTFVIGIPTDGRGMQGGTTITASRGWDADAGGGADKHDDQARLQERGAGAS